MSIRNAKFLLLGAVAAVTLAPAFAGADNPITRPGWGLPMAGGPGNLGGVSCDPADNPTNGANLPFGSCFNQNTLVVRLTGDISGAHPAGSIMEFAEQVVSDKLLQAQDSGGVPSQLFVNFLDLTLKRFLDSTDSTAPSTSALMPQGTIDYDPNTFLYAPVTNAVGPWGDGGYDPLNLGLGCLAIPLVGDVCLNGYLYDVNNEAGQKFFSYYVGGAGDPLNPSFTIRPQANFDVESGWMNGNVCDDTDPNSPCGAEGNLDPTYRDDDDGLQVGIILNNVIVDLLFEPPAHWSLTDIANSATDYDPADDLSAYLKAYGQAELGQVKLTLNIRVAADYNNTVQPHTIAVGFELQNIEFLTDFQFIFQKGPYCNNNLGTTETNFGDVGLSNAAVRPFSNGSYGAAGTPLYGTYVSDVAAGNVLLQYYSQTAATYPTVASNPNGGSGVGRDRIGVGAAPYEFDIANGRYSDNPNNCRRPADACSSASGNVQNGGPEYTTVSANCQYTFALPGYTGGNISDNSDDATYKISEQITSIIPYIQGELRVVAEDTFKNRERGNPGYYLGPTSLANLGEMLSEPLMDDWPLRPGTDYVFIDALLASDVDNDGTNEFWADQWGVMLPFNFALGVSFNAVPAITASTSQRLDHLAGPDGGSCVQKLSGITGYVDGIEEFAANTAGNDVSDDPFLTETVDLKTLRSVPAGVDSDALLGLLAGYKFPDVVTFGNAAPGTFNPGGNRAYGVGLAIHQNVLSAALYDAVIKGLLCVEYDATSISAPITDIALGSTLEGLLNTDTFSMIFPALSQNFPSRPMRMKVIPLVNRYTHGAAGTLPPGFAAFEVTDVVNNKDHLQKDAHAPYVIMGGPEINLPMSGQVLWPDLSIVIPNLLVEFYVYGEDNLWYRAFALDLGVAIGLNIDVYDTPSTLLNLGQPVTGQTYFPIGCVPPPFVTDPNDPRFCDGGQAWTKKVLRLAGLAQPEINAIIEYSELSYQTTTPEGTNVGNAFTDYNVLKGAISNLLGLVLSIDISGAAEIGFDPGAFLNLPLVLDVPYIGPSFVDEGGVNITDREYNPDTSLQTGNGFGDYLVAGIGLDLSALTSAYLIKQIDYLLDGTDSTVPFDLQELNGIGLAPGAVPASSKPIPQAVVDGPVKVSAQETIFRFSGYDALDGQNVKFSWRVDNGVWTPFNQATEARIQGLLEGKHTFEVKALNSSNVVQDAPARYTFVVDSVAPRVRVVGDRTVGGRATFFVEAEDFLTPSEDLRVAYRLNDGRWSNFGYNSKISLSSLRSGRHTLRVKVADNAGNIAESSFNFESTDGGFGCSTTAGAGNLADVLLLLAIPAIVLLRRRFA